MVTACLVAMSASAAVVTRQVRATGTVLVRVEPGSFVMGSPESEPGHKPNESPQTKVVLTHGFWIGRYEVTQGEWRRITGRTVADQAKLAQMDDRLILIGGSRRIPVRDFFAVKKDDPTDLLYGNTDDDLPMIWVSWEEAMEFCHKLTELERQAGTLPEGYEYRLPTEAEWEYAARAGTTGSTYAGEITSEAFVDAPALDPLGWYSANSNEGYTGHPIDTGKWPDAKAGLPGKAGPRKVGMKLPNAWGLYDVLGNAAEWVMDWDGKFPGGTVTDWAGPATGKFHVRKGGGWSSFAPHNRIGFRQWHEAWYRFINLGFRLELGPILPSK